MKIVIDTNVILSAFLTEGLSNKVFDGCLNKFETIISKWILNEIEQILRNKFKIPNSEIKELNGFLRQNLTVSEPKGPTPDICRDKDDNNVLKLASFTNADVIISGDKDLLVLRSYLKTKILSPREFFEKYLRQQ